MILSDPLGPLTLAAPTSREVTILDDDGFAAVKVLSRRLKLDRRGRAAVQLQCPKQARRACVGRLSLTRKRKGKKAVVLGTARYSVKPGRKQRVRVKVKKSKRALVPRRRATKVDLTASARSKALPPVKRRLPIRRV